MWIQEQCTVRWLFISSDDEIDPKDEEAINKACPDIHVSINYEDGVQQVLLTGKM